MFKVRLYCHGFGDSFLLYKQASGPGEPGFTMLIDCGILLGAKDGRSAIKKVVDDIVRMSNGKLDILVVTHEHWDHVSGFVDCFSDFESLSVEEVWMAWTENPEDDVAGRLRETTGWARRRLLQALESSKLGAASAEAVHDALQFYGASSSQRSSRKALENVRRLKNCRGKTATVRYLEPDSTLKPASAQGLSFHILGPPRSLLLLKSQPSKTASETFELENTEPIRKKERPLCPFPTMISKASRSLAKAQETDIDSFNAEELAIKLDSHTNNSSLAMAIRGGNEGKYLLFPGDAQIGSWLSWSGLASIDIQEILKNTIFYKVSHHGSHNATLKTAVEQLSPNSVASFLPVCKETARNVGWTKIPHLPLLRVLKRYGTVLRADDPKSCECSSGRFEVDPHEDKLWLDYFPNW